MRGVSRASLPASIALVIARWRVVYVVTPKAACTSLLWTMAAVQGERLDRRTASLAPEVTRAMTIHDHTVWDHTPALQQLADPELAGISPDHGWFLFALVRHPVHRLWSAWQSKLLMREPHYAACYADRSWFPRLPADERQVREDFGSFVEALAVRPALMGADPHWRPQAEVLRIDAFPYSEIGRVEAMAGVLERLRRHLRSQGWRGRLPVGRENPTLLPLELAGLTAASLRSIQALYAADFEAFGYTTAGLTARQAPAARAELFAALRQIVARNERIADLRRTALARLP